MKKLDPLDLRDSLLEYLERLRKDNIFEYYPSTKGVTKAGRSLNLGFSCFGLKCMYILDNKVALNDDNTLRWSKYINSYQQKSEEFPDYSYIDNNYLINYKKKDFNKNTKDTIKQVLNLINKNKYQTNIKKLENSIIAETKQAISTLSEVGGVVKDKYLDFPSSETSIKAYLDSLDWNKPWASGAQFSSLCVFASTQLAEKNFFNVQNILEKYSTYLCNSKTGSYFLGNQPSNQELINGAMKMITGLDWIGSEIHFPEKLIDLCLGINPDSEGCDLVDIVYVLYMCSKDTSYRKKDIDTYFLDILEKIFLNFKPQDGGFSYFTKKSQTHYYGVKITEGLDTADIHGTTLLLWALSMIYTFKEEESLKFNLIKP